MANGRTEQSVYRIVSVKFENTKELTLSEQKRFFAHTATANITAGWIFYGPPEAGSIGGGSEIGAAFRYTPEVNWDKVLATENAANVVSLYSAWSRYNLGHQSGHVEQIVILSDLLQKKLRSEN